MWEPAEADLRGQPLCRPGLGFEGRPQLVARFAGAGGGRSLLFNGHIDAVSAEPKGALDERSVREPRSATASSTAAAPAT